MAESRSVYPCSSTLNVANFVSVKLNKHNYLVWRMQMLCLIESQDFLGLIDGKFPAPAPADKDYLRWRKSDRLLKGWILGSISNEDVLNAMVGLGSSSARDVWMKLELDNNFYPGAKEQFFSGHHAAVPPPVTTTIAVTTQNDITLYLPLHKAALSGDWATAKEFLDNHAEAISARITSYDETALHIAVGTGKAIHFVRKLVQSMPNSAALVLRNKGGNTALHIAAIVGNTEAAKILVEREPDLVYIYNKHDSLPIHRAAINAHRDTLCYLLSVTKDNVEPNPFDNHSGVKLLIRVIISGFFDIASVLVNRYPHLATLETRKGDSAMATIAKKSSAFRSGSSLNYWDNKIYDCIPVADNCSNHFLCLLQEGLEKLVPHIKHIRQTKLVHIQALKLVKTLCDKITSLNDQHKILHYLKPILLAASLGNHEVVEEIVDAFPEAVWSFDENGQYIFQLAVTNRCEKVFNLIYRMSEHKQYLMRIIDTSENNILHLAGRMAPPHKLNLVSGAALQMQRELQWFKEVEKSVKPAFVEKENRSKQTPAMVFSEEHKDLVKEGEKWMKDTATSCTIAAALITTVVFAAAFTVPGGSNQVTGYPIFSHQTAFIIFAISDAISLFASTTSLVMFLSILTSRYAEEDFLYVLPQRLILGLLTLFISTTCMVITLYGIC